MDTFGEAKSALARSLDIDYADIANNDLWSDTDLGELIKTAARFAWDLHPWPQKGRALQMTVPDPVEAYIDYPDQVIEDSVYLLMVGGKEYKKLDWQSYRKFKQDQPDADDRVFSDFQRYLFINENADTNIAGATVDLFGQLRFVELANSSDKLPFAPDVDGQGTMGNDAIVQLAYADALSSSKKNNPQQGSKERAEAIQKLEALWSGYAKRQQAYQSKDRPMFIVPDFFRSGSPRYKRARFDTADE